MGLRLKVALMLVATIVPIALVFSIWRIGAEHRAHVERRVDRFASRLQRFPGRRCERHPEKFHIDRRDFVGWAYSPEFLSKNPSAPPMREVFGDVDLQVGEPVHNWFRPGKRYIGVTAIRLAESGPCAVLVLGWTDGGVPPNAYNRALLQSGALALLLAIMAGLVTVPIVRRIRRLEHAVRNAQRETFDPGVGGTDEIASLARAFEETLHAVRSREEALEEYIANTTHDLAIPLTVLQHRLRKIAEREDSDDARVALEESHYIAALIANMRTAAKLEHPNQLKLDHDVDLAEIVERVAQRHGPIAKQKGIELNFAVPTDALVVRGEPTLVEQALSNLVQNAVQYNEKGGHVSVVLETTADGFEVRVADDGPGIPEAMRELVLERGVREDAARSRNTAGQGFGLSIVRRVCQLHGWTIEMGHDGGLTVVIRG